MNRPWPPRRSEAETKPAKTPYLHARSVAGLLFGDVIAITGNAKALLQLRSQIVRALKDEGYHSFDEGVYRGADGTEFEAAVKRARSIEEMGEPVPKPKRTAEQLPCAKNARDTAEEER